jgi:hypothetical protein
MNEAKYIGLDVHQATISVAVRDSDGKLVMEAILETKAETILQFVRGLRGSLHVTFEEGTCAAWLYALLKPHVTQVLVCDPRKNALLKVGNKNDRIDSRKLAELLRANLLSSVFHEDTGLRAVKELARSYLTMTKDLTRVMVRLKALYRSWAIPCATKQVYAPRHRAEWLAKIREASVHRRAELYYQQLDALRSLQQQVKKELLIEGRKHSEVAASDSFHPSHPRRASARAHPDTSPFPYQTTIVELLRPGFGDPYQCGIPRGARTTPAFQETCSHSRAQQKP